jgi:hypothetical protein
MSWIRGAVMYACFLPLLFALTKQPAAAPRETAAAAEATFAG